MKQPTLESQILKTSIRVGKMLKERAYDIGKVEWKKKDDPVTDLDRKAERMIRQSLKQYNANFIGEEYGIDDRGADISIYIGPIDGTKSFMRKEFHSSLSIAADDKNSGLFFGVVYDFMRGLLYYADSKGSYLYMPESGKTMNLPIKYPALSKMSLSIDNVPSIYEKIIDPKINVRRPIGSMALSMAQLAQGSYEGLIFVSKKKNGLIDTADFAAGYYILKQTGAYITNIEGKEFDYKRPYKGMIALRQEVKDRIMKRIRT